MYGNKGNNVTFIPKEFIVLKHREFKPQIAAGLVTKLAVGTLDVVHDIISTNSGAGVLNTALVNSMDVDLSKGRVASVPNGWNSERFSFLLVVECHVDGYLVSEEIYQGYSDMVDLAGGRLEHGSTVRINPETMLYINRAIEILYASRSDGSIVPTFSKADSIISDNTSGNSFNINNNLKLLRPVDMAHSYHTDAMVEDTWGDSLVINTPSNYNSVAKFSKSDNEVGGRTITKLIKAANRASLDNTYTFDSSPISKFENMLSDLVENNSTNYKFLRAIGLQMTAAQLSRFNLAELGKFFPNLSPKIFTVESYNDILTRSSNSLLQLGNSADAGDMVVADNQLTRFQKRILPYLFDAMLSYGFIQFSGTITNKTIDGSIALNHSLLMNVSNTVNSNPDIRAHVIRLLYSKLTDIETKELMSNNGTQDVEIIFDLSLTDSNLMINLNNNILRVKVPTLCDSTFTPLVMDSNASKVIMTELKTVVDSVMDIAHNPVYPAPKKW